MKRHVDNFLVYLKNERGLSARTITAYQRDLALFLQFLEAEEIDRPEQVTQHHIRAFIAQRHRQGLGGKSLQRLLSAQRSLFRWLLREGLAEHNPATPVKAPKSPRHLPATLDADSIGQLLEIPCDTPLAIRDKAIMELFYSSGLRLSELAELRWEQLDLAARPPKHYWNGKKTAGNLPPLNKLLFLSVNAETRSQCVLSNHAYAIGLNTRGFRKTFTRTC